MRILYLSIIVAIVASAGIASVAALGPTVIDGKLTVNNGGFLFERDDNVQTTLQLKNSDKQQAFQFEDPNDLQKYLFRSTPGPTGNVEFLDFSGASPVARTDISIERSNGNVGIATNTPTEKLDVNGNIKLSGNILSNGDICIGTCP